MASKRRESMWISKNLLLYSGILLFTISCNRKMPVYEEINKDAVINPDYTSVTVPPNIAPLNFKIGESADRYLVRFYNSDGFSFIVGSGTGSIIIPEKKWHRLLAESVSKEFHVDILMKKSRKWQK